MAAVVRPLSRAITQTLSVAIVIAWAVTMGVLVHRSYSQTSANLATDLASYGSDAIWRGVYYRGEKIGFTVSQTVAEPDGFALEEDGRLQMALLGAESAATIRTRAHVDAHFALRAFEFSLDPGTGPLSVSGRVAGRHLTLDIATAAGTRREERDLDAPPALSLNLSRRLAEGGLRPGAHHEWLIFDPATLRNEPVEVAVGRRELVRGSGLRPMPAFRVDMTFAGLRTTSWVTDTGEVVREESPLGMITVRESASSARAMAVSRQMQVDLLETAAVTPRMRTRIDDPRSVRRLRLKVAGAELNRGDVNGGTQRVDANGTIEIVDPERLQPDPGDDAPGPYLEAETFIESDAPEIRAEALKAIAGAVTLRTRAERLTRYVNALLEKKPTVSLPSAREVLRTKVGDCNEHTALYVAMARAAGVPARIAVGLVYVHGAFYYHAWPEVLVEAPSGRGRVWLPVDPTLNEFPADATHLRLARGGLEKQAAILPLIGRLSIDVLEADFAPDARPILVGAAPADLGALAIPMPNRSSACCRCGS